MGLRIRFNEVHEVLLADGWHKVTGFNTDSYEFCAGEKIIFKGGQSPLVCSTGFEFTEKNGDIITGPLTSIIAVKWIKIKRG